MSAARGPGRLLQRAGSQRAACDAPIRPHLPRLRVSHAGAGRAAGCPAAAVQAAGSLSLQAVGQCGGRAGALATSHPSISLVALHLPPMQSFDCDVTCHYGAKLHQQGKLLQRAQAGRAQGHGQQGRPAISRAHPACGKRASRQCRPPRRAGCPAPQRRCRPPPLPAPPAGGPGRACPARHSTAEEMGANAERWAPQRVCSDVGCRQLHPLDNIYERHTPPRTVHKTHAPKVTCAFLASAPSPVMRSIIQRCASGGAPCVLRQSVSVVAQPELAAALCCEPGAGNGRASSNPGIHHATEQHCCRRPPLLGPVGSACQQTLAIWPSRLRRSPCCCTIACKDQQQPPTLHSLTWQLQ